MTFCGRGGACSSPADRWDLKGPLENIVEMCAGGTYDLARKENGFPPLGFVERIAVPTTVA